MGRGEPLSGRAALYILLKRYEIDRGAAVQVDLSVLLALTYNGELELFLDKIDSVLAGLVVQPRGAALRGHRATAAEG